MRSLVTQVVGAIIILSVPIAVGCTADSSVVTPLVSEPPPDGSSTAGSPPDGVLTVTTSSLPSGRVNQSYETTLEASGGDADYSWTITAGSLPSGLALASSTGVISGTPATPTNNSITVRVEDGGGLSAERELSLRVFDEGELASYPNEPGNFALISYESGDKIMWDGWRNGGAAWNGDNPDGGPPTVVTDTSCPVGDRAVEFRTEVDTKGDGSNKLHFGESVYQSNGVMDSFYIAFWIYRDETESDAHKWFYFGEGDGGNPVDSYFGRASNPGSLRLVAQRSDPAVYFRDDRELLSANQWVLWETLVGTESAPGAKDGHLSIWIDGERIYSTNSAGYTGSSGTTGFSGVTWYAWRNDPPGAPERFYRICGLKISGMPR